MRRQSLSGNLFPLCSLNGRPQAHPHLSRSHPGAAPAARDLRGLCPCRSILSGGTGGMLRYRSDAGNVAMALQGLRRDRRVPVVRALTCRSTDLEPADSATPGLITLDRSASRRPLVRPAIGCRALMSPDHMAGSARISGGRAVRFGAKGVNRFMNGFGRSASARTGMPPNPGPSLTRLRLMGSIEAPGLRRRIQRHAGENEQGGDIGAFLLAAGDRGTAGIGRLPLASQGARRQYRLQDQGGELAAAEGLLTSPELAIRWRRRDAPEPEILSVDGHHPGSAGDRRTCGHEPSGRAGRQRHGCQHCGRQSHRRSP